MPTKYLSSTSASPPSPLRKAAGLVAATAAAGVALMFSAMLLALMLSVGTAGFAYLWWKTRKMRKQMRERMRDFPHPGENMEREVFGDEAYEGEVIEGEAVRVDDPRNRIAG